MWEFTLIGVDPGIVHSGIVSLTFIPNNLPKVEAIVVDGADAAGIAAAVQQINKKEDHFVFVEKYQDRVKGFKQDSKMRKLETELMGLLLSTGTDQQVSLVNNTGVKKLVPQRTMEALGCWTFSQKTHHQDLRSAARIALLGAARTPSLSRALYQHLLPLTAEYLVAGEPTPN